MIFAYYKVMKSDYDRGHSMRMLTWVKSGVVFGTVLHNKCKVGLARDIALTVVGVLVGAGLTYLVLCFIHGLVPGQPLVY